jgi:phospholipid/cholesterol/gamma-HCH transport system substrate-binding protein
MDDGGRRSLVVGSFVIVALALGAFALLSLGGGAGLLSPRYELITYFENVQGLVVSAPVRLAGKDVGRVSQVRFGRLGEARPPVRVVMQVDASVQDRIRSDSVASIATVGLLGDKYVELSMGTPEATVLGNGQEIASVSPMDLSAAVERGTQAIDNIATLAENVNQVVSDFGEAMGGQRAADVTRGLAEVVEEVKVGDGLLHSLIYDRYEGSGVDSAEKALITLEDILREVAEGEGLLHDLIYEEADTLAGLAAADERLNSILEKIDAGEGTLGLLVNDPGLYADLQALLGGAQRSRVVRTLIRLSGEGE